MIGEKIFGQQGIYEVIKCISGPKRPNANVYLCKTENGDHFIAKHFYNKIPMPNISYGKKNHYGRRRDGSILVFNEIREKCKSYPFLVKHLERIRFKNKWIIIQEYIEGQTFYDFIIENKDNLNIVLKAVEILAKTLTLWHCNKFAHGDPHLENAIIQTYSDGNMNVKLIDYSQIHHPDFHYCKKYECFSNQNRNRRSHDLHEPCNKLGRGFRTGLAEVGVEIMQKEKLLLHFDKNYTYLIPSPKIDTL